MENLQKLPKTINKPPKTFKNRQNFQNVQKNIEEFQKTFKKTVKYVEKV